MGSCRGLPNLAVEMSAKQQQKKSKGKPSAAPSKSRFGRQARWLWLLGLGPLFGLAGLVLIGSMGDLPNTETLANPKTDLATRVYSSDGRVIGRYYAENRSDSRFEELPDHLIGALISTEDARFESHSGLDFIGLARAIAFMGSRGGGSTITQQLAKLLFTESYDQTSLIKRALLQKPQEWIIAARLERHYTKGEIIALYLNRYDFLNQAVGIKSAANIYFDKDVNELNIQESAMLVGMLKNSALYNPLRRPELVMNRRNVVLNQMVKYDRLTRAACDSLAELPLGINFQRVSHDEGIAPYFREELRAELKRLLAEKDANGQYIIRKADGSPYDLYRDGIQVFSTIDSRLQRAAEDAVHAHLANELQGTLDRDLRRRSKSDWPFYSGIDRNTRDAIMDRAMRESERFLIASGKLCPECKRPGFYIRKAPEGSMWECNAEKGGCSHTWHRPSEKEIEDAFEAPVPMRIFSHAGGVDTVMTPMDSIRYRKHFLHAGLMSIEPQTGHIKAWVGGIDYRHFKYDNVSQSRRQVGSIFKPFVYATALRYGLERCTEIPNQKICIEMPDGQPDWCPDNSDFEYGDIVTLEYALANSMNTVTAKLIKDFGAHRVAELAYALGIESTIPEVPSIALGAAQLTLKEITGANAALVNGGVYVRPTYIARIEDKFGNVIYTPEPEIHQGLDARTAATIVQMMKGVVDGAYSIETGKRKGTGVRLRMDLASRAYDGIRIPMAGKTGTTQSNTDGWFMGLTPDLVTGVWVGAQDPAVRFSTTTNGQGANTALPIFGYYMKAALADNRIGLSGADFTIPESLGLDSLDCEQSQSLRGLPFGGGVSGDGGLFD
jgi:penicillin-binding protein 1A